MGLSSTGFSLFICLQISVSLAFISHLRCAFSDPGKTPKLDPVEVHGEEVNYCEFCDQYKPPRTHHCRKCCICIHRMDHHCIWINNCVGFLNHKYFLLFLMYIMLSAAIGILIILYCGFLFLKSRGEFIHWKVFLVLVAGFECLLFMIFTGDYLWEQISLITNSQSTIERVHRKYGENFGRLENMKRILGSNMWLWFLPVSSRIPCDYIEPLYAFSEMVLQRNKKIRFTAVASEYNLIG